MSGGSAPKRADWRIADGVRVEELDGSWLALDPSGGVVYRLEARAAEVMRHVSNRQAVPGHLVPAARELAGHGVLAHPFVDRRTALVGAGVVTLTGLAATLLPSAAAASTGGGGGSPAPVAWTGRTDSDAVEKAWTAVTFGSGQFVAVAQEGSGSYVIRSSDGVSWDAATDEPGGTGTRWMGVAYGQPDGVPGGRFVAVGFDKASPANTGRVMTSDDGGVTWTSRTPANTNQWQGVTYGGGLYVAVAGTGTRVMTSPDGITWTQRSTENLDFFWNRITFGNGTFVAVGGTFNGTGAAMTSPDGTTWTARAVPDRWWTDVAFGSGRFVAVARSAPFPEPGRASGVMTSTDGVTWSESTASAAHDWTGVAFGSPSGTGIFAAVAQTGDTAAAMVSTNGSTWSSETTPVAGWNSVAYGNGVFVAVALTSRTTNQVMTRP